SSLRPDPVNELASVFGGPAGLGRNQARPRDAAVTQLGSAYLQSLDRTAHGGVGQAPARADPFAKADNPGKRVHDAEAMLARTRDQQPAIVRAEVEGCIVALAGRRRSDRLWLHDATANDRSRAAAETIGARIDGEDRTAPPPPALSPLLR